MKNVAIFASGTGTNAKKIIDYFHTNPYIRIRLVVSNKMDAPVLQIAREHHIDTLIINRKDFYETTQILDDLNAYAIDFIVLAGFLWLVPPYLVQAFDKRMVNIHPALLPKYGGKGMYGMRVHEAVKAAGDLTSGITIHYVSENYDEGDIVLQASCAIKPNDTADAIAKKIHALEYKYLAPTIEKLIMDQNRVDEIS